MKSSKLSNSRPIIRKIVPAALIIAAVLAVVYACRHYSVVRTFLNPIACTMVNDTLYVVEKEKNTVLQLEYISHQQPLESKGMFRIEKDDAKYYYMARKLYPGLNGVVVHSYIYDRETGDFVGFRFREYHSFSKAPREIFTIFLQYPKDYPEISYALDVEGNHYFVNDCAGQYNIWKVPAAGNVIMENGVVPSAIQELGDRNEALSNWLAAYVDPEGRIFISSGATERVVEYLPDGRRIREIGTAGFNTGDLLAPDELSFVPIAYGEPAYLTVASTGNRTWVQFNRDGKPVRTISPLHAGYPFPDILVGSVFEHTATRQICSMDLVNKCLIIISRQFATVTTYRTKQIEKTCLFLGIAVILILLAVFYNRLVAFSARMKFPFFLKLLALFIPLLVVSGLVVGDWVKDVMKADLETESIRRSANLSRAIINSVSIADLESIQAPEDRESQAYERIYTTVNRIVDTKNVESTPKWIIHKIRNGRFYFGINIWRGPIYEPFIVPRERRMFFKALSEKTCQFGRFFDEQGEWFSYLSPITNAKGEVINILELYRPTEEMDRADLKVAHRVGRIVGVTVLIAVLLALLFSFVFTRPLRKLMKATEIVSTGDFNHPIEVHSRDEMNDLACAFNQMVVNLKKYTEDLARTTAEKERIQSELRFAREVQQGIVPKTFPPFAQAGNIEIFARMEPAREVGGDYYDFFLVDKDHMGVVIADVSGKGVPAGLFMMVVRTLLRSNALGNISAADAIAKMNTLIAPDNPSAMFVTMFYFICNMRTGKITFCNAGHNPPVMMTRNKTEFLANKDTSGKGIVVGALDDAQYSDANFILAAGESLVLYTDGVTEPINKEDQMYGEQRLIRCIEANAGLPNREICDKIYQEVSEHQKGLEQFDDITVLFFKFLG